MATLVHITDEKRVEAILRAGIRPSRSNKAVYFMPVLQSHFVSHQWIRELRRGGAKTLVGIYFRLPSSEMVWAGRYNQIHRRLTLGESIRELTGLKDPLGYEVFIDRTISKSEIQKVKTLPQNIGWRYMPHAHGRPLCGCPVCLPKGGVKSKALRERLEPRAKVPSLIEVKARLGQSPNDDDVMELLWALRGKKRRADPSFMEPWLIAGSLSVLEDVAMTLPFFRHPQSERMLELLCGHPDINVSEVAKEGLNVITSQRDGK